MEAFYNNIWVSVEGDAPITLADLIAINNEEGEEPNVTQDDIAELRNLPVGQSYYIGICEVTRIS